MAVVLLPTTLWHNDMVVGVTWALTAICIILVALRFYVRVTIRQLSSDDWIMLLAVIIQIAYEVLLTLFCARPPPGVSRDAILNDVIVYGLWSILPAILVAIVARISAAIFLIRTFGVKTWFKWYLIVLTAAQTAAAVIALILNFGRVVPVEGLWDREKLVKQNWGADLYKYPGVICSTLFAISDLTYVLFPTMIIWKLKMPRARRLALCSIMALSLVTMVAAILKGLITLGLHEFTLPFRPNDGFLWSGIEQTLVIIMGTLPTLIPMIAFDNLFMNYVRSVVRQISSLGDGSRRSASTSRNPAATIRSGGGIEQGSVRHEAVELNVVSEEQRLTKDYTGREEVVVSEIHLQGSTGRGDCESGRGYSPSCYGNADQASATYSNEDIHNPKEGL